MGYIIFCDTNLGFNLAVPIVYNDTVGDLKRKFMTEHAAVFPDTGEMKGAFYHLPDSAVVMDVFHGDNAKQFLQIDAALKVDGVADV